MKHLGLFEGIGGFSLAARWMEWETLAWCEWNEFGQRVLRYHFPEAEGFGDITKTDFTKYANKIDILTGGFPCQPYSSTGKRLGKEDERHLWPEMLRAIREIQPRYVVGENVRGLTNWNGGVVFDEVQADLEAAGYEVLPFLLPACAVNAPHRRERIWFIAYSESSDAKRIGKLNDYKGEGGAKIREGFRNESQRFTEKWLTPYTTSEQKQSGGARINQRKEHQPYNGQGIWDYFRASCGDWSEFPTQSPVCSGNDGLPSGLDGITFSKHRNESIKAYGNAIVPQVALQIFKAIEEYERTI
jgi:DNA (cytosine-5)-methyltransferase 1